MGDGIRRKERCAVWWCLALCKQVLSFVTEPLFGLCGHSCFGFSSCEHVYVSLVMGLRKRGGNTSLQASEACSVSQNTFITARHRQVISTHTSVSAQLWQMMEMVVINHGKVHGKPGQAVTWPLELIRFSGSELIHLYPLIINLNSELKADGESNKASTYSSDDAPQTTSAGVQKQHGEHYLCSAVNRTEYSAASLCEAWLQPCSQLCGVVVASSKHQQVPNDRVVGHAQILTSRRHKKKSQGMRKVIRIHAVKGRNVWIRFFLQPMIQHLLTRFTTRQSWWPHGGTERKNRVIKRVSGIHCEKPLMPRHYFILNISSCWLYYFYLLLDIFY